MKPSSVRGIIAFCLTLGSLTIPQESRGQSAEAVSKQATEACRKKAAQQPGIPVSCSSFATVDSLQQGGTIEGAYWFEVNPAYPVVDRCSFSSPQKQELACPDLSSAFVRYKKTADDNTLTFGDTQLECMPGSELHVSTTATPVKPMTSRTTSTENPIGDILFNGINTLGVEKSTNATTFTVACEPKPQPPAPSAAATSDPSSAPLLEVARSGTIANQLHDNSLSAACMHLSGLNPQTGETLIPTDATQVAAAAEQVRFCRNLLPADGLLNALASPPFEPRLVPRRRRLSPTTFVRVGDSIQNVVEVIGDLETLQSACTLSNNRTSAICSPIPAISLLVVKTHTSPEKTRVIDLVNQRFTCPPEADSLQLTAPVGNTLTVAPGASSTPGGLFNSFRANKPRISKDEGRTFAIACMREVALPSWDASTAPIAGGR